MKAIGDKPNNMMARKLMIDFMMMFYLSVERDLRAAGGAAC